MALPLAATLGANALGGASGGKTNPLKNLAGGLSAASSAGGNDQLSTRLGDRIKNSGIQGGGDPFGPKLEPWMLLAVGVLLVWAAKRG